MSTKAICYLATYLLLSLESFSQIQSSTSLPPSLDELVTFINRNSQNFNFPNLDDTITVGTIDLSALSAAEIGFSFNVPVSLGSKYSYPNPNFREEPTLPVLHSTGYVGTINLVNELHVNLKFRIKNWLNSKDCKLNILLDDRLIKLNYGDTVAVFRDVKSDNPKLSIRAEGFNISPDLLRLDPTYYRGKQAVVYGLDPLRISRKNLELGVFTLPIIPLFIVYAPPVDSHKSNKASAGETQAIGNSTTITFVNEKSTTTQYNTSFDDVKTTQDYLNTTAEIYSKIPLPVTQAIAKAASEISTGLGSAEATQTISQINLEQHATSAVLQKSISVTTDPNDGGPGRGDVFVYYRNAKVMWRNEDGKIFLTLLGGDPIEQISGAKLKEGLTRLQSKPKGTKDKLLKLTALSIKQLLMLDPETNMPGGATLADTKRFLYLDSWHVSSGINKQNFKHTITTDDLKSISNITTYIETDKEGKLAALGLGIDRNASLLARVTQSNSQKYSTIQESNIELTINGDGLEKRNSVKIYFDTVFNSYVIHLINNK